MHTITGQKNNEIEPLADELVFRLRKKQYQVSRENEKIYADNQVFLLNTGHREFMQNETGDYLLPAEFGAEVLTAFILHILQKHEKMYHEAVSFVHSIGIRPNLYGYRFLIAAICLGMKNSDSLYSVTETIYPAVASLYHVDTRCVERNIRNAVNDAYKNDPERLRKPFYYKVEKPYDSELIALAIDAIHYKNNY